MNVTPLFSSRIASASVAALLSLLAPYAAGAAEEPVPQGSIIPKPSAPDPQPFTLVDRYLDAARRGDLAMLRRCLDKGVDAKVKDEVGRSALMLAVRDGHSLEVSKFLVELGLAVDEPDARGRSALADAAGLGQSEIVAFLLEKGADPKRRDGQGQTALYNAVLAGSRESVLSLLAAGAAIDSQDNFGDTPLIGACNKGNDEMARLLVEKGADPSLRDQEGRTAKQRAAEGAKFCQALPEEKKP